MHEGRIRTSSRRPEVRLLYVGIALVLRNLGVWLHYTVLARPRRGGRVILLERLRWETLLLWLLHVVEEAGQTHLIRKSLPVKGLGTVLSRTLNCNFLSYNNL